MQNFGGKKVEMPGLRDLSIKSYSRSCRMSYDAGLSRKFLTE